MSPTTLAALVSVLSSGADLPGDAANEVSNSNRSPVRSSERKRFTVSNGFAHRPAPAGPGDSVGVLRAGRQ